MTVLIIDTSQPEAWVALVRDRQVLAERAWASDKALGGKLLTAIAELTAGARPERIAVHRGPGRFMALRTGLVTAQLLVQTWNVELVEIAARVRTDLIDQAVAGKPVP